jgi:hypothetical protein
MMKYCSILKFGGRLIKEIMFECVEWIKLDKIESGGGIVLTRK